MHSSTRCSGGGRSSNSDPDPNPNPHPVHGPDPNPNPNPIPIYHRPGEADLSVDVDFDAVRRAALSEATGLRVSPLVDQRDFLAAMGLEPRVNVRRAGLEPQTSRPRQVCYSHVRASPWTGAAGRAADRHREARAHPRCAASGREPGHGYRVQGSRALPPSACRQRCRLRPYGPTRWLPAQPGAQLLAQRG